ncbi:hypothetical protein FXB78_05190 [Aggregatibacter actinomycetemcomitans]|uniref:hypothetical protein n=1 Tax=Aggregatibacter actinomycetemcomitans TaxID=714 RepID=UPI0011D6A2AC|nr:hypothetical protein [Aggregatibacter actinomycetemcomitans]QEH45945.1 hypothetical protein FXN58_10710 [Aggregatibacter actinomycetemcomitans]QEH48031.1 hypothetical protein FXN59_11110 [Aggregatibacter actinomycetemcomitans]QEH50026.1 hypothetical protein FXN57_10790 [Aggregatibacter actinomycetemcomitans]TYA49129.1 hypothetical protein FXB74_06190 [Aggregatibacter actinomycetemcomitans]TYA51170.1 hypothetical protein FXB81_05275 [Aggregatibacter actinomycetemcomitans]
MRLLFLTFTLLIIYATNCYAKESLQLGWYKADNCDVEIFIEKQNGFFFYKVESANLDFSGQAYLSDGGLMFGKFMNYIDNNSYDVVGNIISSDRFVIQNYGNSMNMYNNIPDCDGKYLEYKLSMMNLMEIKHKSILYVNPNEKSNMYLIKGDKVRIIKDKLDDKGIKWYFINYKGKKEINMWIKADSVNIK